MTAESPSQTCMEKLTKTLAELDAKVRPETDEIYIRYIIRESRPWPISAMPYDLRTNTQAALLGYRSRDAEVEAKDAEIARLKARLAL